MELRLLTPEEIPGSIYVWQQAFDGGRRVTEEWDRLYGERGDQVFTVGVWDAHGLQALTVTQAYRQYLGALAQVGMGGVMGVACLPAARGRGYAATAIRFALEQMRERGLAVSVLEPFSWDYYRGLGWDWTGLRRWYEARTEALPGDPDTEHVRAGTEEDIPLLERVYKAEAARYRGFCVRDALYWRYRLGPREDHHTYIYLYERDGQPEGYLFYRGGHKEAETRLEEFVALTPRAHKALLGLLRRHAMQVDKFSWSAPGDDRLWSLFMHWRLDTKLWPKCMSRIVDVPAALACWAPQDGRPHRATVEVSDPNAPWNAGTWLLETDGGTIHAQRTTQSAAVKLDIQALTQAYYGTPSLDALREADRVVVEDEAGYQQLRSMLDGPTMFCRNNF